MLQIDFGSEIFKDHFNIYIIYKNEVLFILLFNKIYLNFVKLKHTYRLNEDLSKIFKENRNDSKFSDILDIK